MEAILNKSNLTKAGCGAVVALLAMNLTASRSKLIQGGAVVVALAVAMPFVAKLG